MASLKDMRVRIASTKATQKITKAMQMVAASKLRRAQAAAVVARPYAEHMEKVLRNIAAAVAGSDSAPRLLAGTGATQVHLLVVCTAERGLCGPFNSAIVRLARDRALALAGEGKQVKFLCGARTVYDYEPEEGEILGELMPRYLATQVFRALLENAASEQGARMSAMDNATRNAGDMIRKQTLTYNRTRQAMITKELIEIISGAEAL